MAILISVITALSVSILLYYIYCLQSTGVGEEINITNISQSSREESTGSMGTGDVDEDVVRIEGLTLERLITIYRHCILEYHYYNSSSSNTSYIIVEYSVYDDRLDGENVHKLILSYTANDNIRANMTIWFSQDYREVIQIKMYDRIMTGSYAKQLAYQMIYSIDKFLYSATRSDLVFREYNSRLEILTDGWIIESVAPQVISFKGEEITGYYIKVVNMNDTNNTLKSMEGRIAKLVNDQYSFIEYKAIYKNGDYALLTIKDLE